MSTTSSPRRTQESAIAVLFEAVRSLVRTHMARRDDGPPAMVRNATASRLVLLPPKEPGPSQPADPLELAPFECQALPQGMWTMWQPSLQRLCGRRKIEILRPTRATVLDRLPGLCTAVLVVATMGLLITGASLGTRTAWLAIGAALGLMLLVWAAVRTRHRVHLSFLAALGAALLISAAMPALALYYAAGVDQLIAALRDGAPGPDTLVIVGRIAQWGFIWIAAFLPAGLYFLFDRVKLATLRETFERDILRFDPTVETVPDVRARYGAAMSEAFTSDIALGREERAYEADPDAGDATAEPRRRPRTPHRQGRVFYRQIPVLLATVVISLGWTLALLNPDGPVVERGGGDEYMLGLLQPHASPIVFAFIGAYTFTLLALFRSYVRSDLRPKSYTHAAVRIVVAMIFAWVLAVLFLEPTTDLAMAGNGGLLAVSFIVGFVPETLLVRLQEVARAFARGQRPLSWLYERHPLTRLVGIDIYDRARLLEEGVGNIEGLAHHDLPELMLHTRIPVGRIVHWADQAILYLHVVSSDEKVGDGQTGPPSPGDREEGETRLRRLRGYGISTATALICAHDKLEDPRARERFQHLLDDKGDDFRGRPPRLEVVIAAIRSEQWIPYLEAWHSWCHANPDTVVWSWDGRLRTRRRRQGTTRPDAAAV